MSSRKSAPELPRAAEALLGNFPIPERDWDEDLSRIQARIKTAPPEFDAALLDAPALPPEPGEEPAPRSGVNSSLQGQSLAELARASVAKKRNQKDASEIAKESFLVATQARSQTLEIAERQRKARDAEPSRPDLGPISTREAMPSSARAPSRSETELQAPAAEPPTPAAATVAQQTSARRGMLIGGATAVLALAAAFAIWRQDRADSPATSVAALPSTVAAAPQVGERKANEVIQPRVAEEPTALQVEQLPKSAPAALRPSPASASAPITAKRMRSPIGFEPMGGAYAANSTAAPAAPPPATAPATKAAADEKALPSEPAMAPAVGAAGGIPQKPSTGAVQAALGSVMAGARGCVAGHEQPSSAVVVFASDGKVQSVQVSGPAAGTPAAACIESRLKRARVQPFAASSFSVNTTIRPE